MTRTGSAVIFLTVIVLAGCNKNGGNQNGSPTAPSGSGGTAVTGGWTGTLSRPNGLPPIALKWQVTTENNVLVGPMTLTNGATSVTITARGNTAGNDNNGYTIHLSFSSNQGEVPGLPDCTVRGNTMGPQQGDAFASPYRAIVVATFDISYNSCRPFVEYASPQANFLQETVRLDLTKQ